MVKLRTPLTTPTTVPTPTPSSSSTPAPSTSGDADVDAARRPGPATLHFDLDAMASPTSPTVLPATPAAPLSSGSAGSTSGATHARVADKTGALGALDDDKRAPSSKVRAQVDRFLHNEKVQQVGDAARELARAGVDGLSGEVDLLLSTIGTGTDAVADATIATGEALDRLADEGRLKLKGAVTDLRARADRMVADARASLDAMPAGLEQGQEAEQSRRAWATGQLLGAVADKIDALLLVEGKDVGDELKRFLAYGGSALFRVASELFDFVGELVHMGAKALAAGITLTGQFLKWLVGKDTLRSTGITVFGGARMNVVSQSLNAGVGGGLFFPSFKDADEKIARGDAKTYFDTVAFDWGASACSPVAGGGWNSRGGAGAGVNLYFLSASFNAMTERVFIGVPGVWGITLGRDAERGSEINFGNGIGLAGGPQLGAYATYGVSLHTPLLDPINHYVTRPIAKVIVEVSKLVAAGAKKAWQAIQRLDDASSVNPSSSSSSSSL